MGLVGKHSGQFRFSGWRASGSSTGFKRYGLRPGTGHPQDGCGLGQAPSVSFISGYTIVVWFHSLHRRWTNNHAKRKAVRPSHRPAAPRQARLAVEQLECREVPTGGLTNVGELIAPDTNVKSLYE